jgi:hypothetical protein
MEMDVGKGGPSKHGVKMIPSNTKTALPFAVRWNLHSGISSEVQFLFQAQSVPSLSFSRVRPRCAIKVYFTSSRLHIAVRCLL